MADIVLTKTQAWIREQDGLSILYKPGANLAVPYEGATARKSTNLGGTVIWTITLGDGTKKVYIEKHDPEAAASSEASNPDDFVGLFVAGGDPGWWAALCPEAKEQAASLRDYLRSPTEVNLFKGGPPCNFLKTR